MYTKKSKQLSLFSLFQALSSLYILEFLYTFDHRPSSYELNATTSNQYQSSQVGDITIHYTL